MSGGMSGVTREPVGARKRMVRAPRWSAPAWAAIAVATLFVVLSWWWQAVDRSVPYNDAAQNLFFAFRYRDLLAQGRVMDAFDLPNWYPPASYLIGAGGAFVAGVHVAVPVLAQNLVYVPLLALACYRVGRMLAGSTAGLLAVVFALGTPLIIEQFHLFMLDVPQATLVAAAVWLVLESERFAKIGPAAAAGLALGLGLATKELAALYVIGLVACVLVRGGGWRNWRGLLVFAGVAALVAAPWYVRQAMLGELDRLWNAAGPGGAVPPLARPPRLSSDNLLWYLWATLNGLLFAPLFAFAAIGVGIAIARVPRTRRLDDITPELVCGLGGAWLVLLLMPHKDMRYTLGLIVYLAVLGTAWLTRLRPAPRAVAIAVLVTAMAAGHLGATFGVGGETTRRLPGARNATWGEGVPPLERVVVYSNHNFSVSGPHRHPDVLALLRGLRREGVLTIGVTDSVDPYDRNFEEIGLWVLSRVAGIQVTPYPEAIRPPALGQALLTRTLPTGTQPPPCLWLADGSGVWVQAGSAPGVPPRENCPRTE